MFEPIAIEQPGETSALSVEQTNRIHTIDLNDTSSEFSSFAQIFLSSGQMSVEDLSEKEKHIRTDPQLLKPIPDPNLSPVLFVWEKKRGKLANVLNEYDDLLMKTKLTEGDVK